MSVDVGPTVGMHESLFTELVELAARRRLLLPPSLYHRL